MAFRPRVAVAGVGHYHAGFYPHYLALLKKHGCELVAVSDPQPGMAERRAAPYGARPFTDYQVMVETTKPDFVLALGRHCDMPATFRYLVEAGVPFVMEKPWGVDAATVRELAALAEQRDAWVAAPLAMRYTFWAETARGLIANGEAGAVSHIRYRMVRPGVARYVEQESAWMLNKAEAGGGVLLNLGIHGFDLCRWLTGEEPEVVSAVVSNAVHRLDIEDYAHVTLRTPSGVLFHNEVAYTYPAGGGNDDERKLAAEKALVVEESDTVHVVRAGSDEVLSPPLGYLAGWEGVLVDCLRRLSRREPPPNAPSDCARAVSLVFEAYRMAGALAP